MRACVGNFWFCVAWFAHLLPSAWRLTEWLAEQALTGLIVAVISVDDDIERDIISDHLTRFARGEERAIDKLRFRMQQMERS